MDFATIHSRNRGFKSPRGPSLYPRSGSPFCFFPLFWGPFVFPPTKTEHFFRWGPSSSLGLASVRLAASAEVGLAGLVAGDPAQPLRALGLKPRDAETRPPRGFSGREMRRVRKLFFLEGGGGGLGSWHVFFFFVGGGGGGKREREKGGIGHPVFVCLGLSGSFTAKPLEKVFDVWQLKLERHRQARRRVVLAIQRDSGGHRSNMITQKSRFDVYQHTHTQNESLSLF